MQEKVGYERSRVNTHRNAYVLPINFTFKGTGGTLGSDVENEFEYLVDRGGHSGHLAEKFLKNIVPSQSYHGYHISQFGCCY